MGKSDTLEVTWQHWYFIHYCLGSIMAYLSMPSIQNSMSLWTADRQYLWSEKHLRYGYFKRWQKMTIGCLTCCGPTKSISHFEGLSIPTTAQFELLKILEISCKLHCTTRKSYHICRYGQWYSPGKKARRRSVFINCSTYYPGETWF